MTRTAERDGSFTAGEGPGPLFPPPRDSIRLLPAFLREEPTGHEPSVVDRHRVHGAVERRHRGPRAAVPPAHVPGEGAARHERVGVVREALYDFIGEGAKPAP